MGTLSLTVQVLDLSPRVTLADLKSFFSYCGTIDSVQLHRNKDQSQLGFVTFKQPYAFQTALLLSGATIVDRPVRILALPDSEILHTSDKMNNETPNNVPQGFAPAVQSAMQAMASRGVEILNKKKDELGENFKVSEKSRALVHQTSLALDAAERTAGAISSTIMKNDYVLSGTRWFSDVMNEASKRVAELGNRTRDNDNFRKQN